MNHLHHTGVTSATVDLMIPEDEHDFKQGLQRVSVSSILRKCRRRGLEAL